MANYSLPETLNSAGDSSMTVVAGLLIFGYIALIVITVAGNCLVIAAFHREPALRHITNYWIVSLSLTDIFLAAAVMPLQVAREFHHGKWYFGELGCDIFVMLDVLCCTCSIYHLALISLDRFFCVRFPIAYPSFRTSRKTILAIVVTWVWCTFISIPQLVVPGLKNYPDPNDNHTCTMTNQTYMISSSLMSFYIPLLLILIMYYLIYRATQARTRRFQRELAVSMRVRNYTSNPGPSSSGTHDAVATELNTIPESVGRQDTNASDADADDSASTGTVNMNMLPDQRPNSHSPAASNTAHRNRTSLMRRLGNAMSLQPLLTRSQTTDCVGGTTPTPVSAPLGVRRYRKMLLKSEPNLAIEGDMTSDADSEVVSASTAASLASIATQRRANRLARTSSDQERRQQKITKAKLNKKRQRQEHRTARVVVIVLGAFVAFWAPFFITNIIDPLCGFCVDVDIWRGVVFWGYCNSAINPFIYTFFNRTFRRAITAVIRCQSKRRHF